MPRSSLAVLVAFSTWTTCEVSKVKETLAIDKLREHCEVVTDTEALQRAGANVSGLASRGLLGIVSPCSVEEVQSVVRWANEQRVPLYPTSTGKNWGLGSRIPVVAGCLLLDLSRMQRIRELNVRHGYAVVEPGVTQGQLQRKLQADSVDMAFNVTGSAIETSIIGNALERGVGYFSSRVEDVWLCEAVLGTGELLRFAAGSMSGSRTSNLYRYGVGPDLEGLFFQSSFGIVTAASIALVPRSVVQGTLLMGIQDDGKLEEFIDAVRDLHRDRILTSSVHIGNGARTRITIAPAIYEQLDASHGNELQRRNLAERIVAVELPNRWSAVVGVGGSSKQMKETLRLTRLRCRNFCKVRLLSPQKYSLLVGIATWMPWAKRQRMLLSALRPSLSLGVGIPNDGALQSVGWPLRNKIRGNPDESSSGLLYSLPMIPLDGDAVREVVALTESVFAAHNFEAYITLNVVARGALEGVINLAFDRASSSETERAHACLQVHHEELKAKGFLLYRVGVYGMDHVVDSEHTYWKRIARLKSVFDPNWILAPGRYAPLARNTE
jgi:4-cresol dehydrogenase (hydroxylating) flavoprotein subunit